MAFCVSEKTETYLSTPHDRPEDCPTYYDGCHCTMETMVHNMERAERFREALEFYANPDNWWGTYTASSKAPMYDDWSDVEDDAAYPDGKPGKRAREALKE